MTKTSTHGILSFKEAMETQKKDFLETLQTLDFKEFTTEKKIERSN